MPRQGPTVPRRGIDRAAATIGILRRRATEPDWRGLAWASTARRSGCGDNHRLEFRHSQPPPAIHDQNRAGNASHVGQPIHQHVRLHTTRSTTPDCS